jgi:hypothetical protein
VRVGPRVAGDTGAEAASRYSFGSTKPRYKLALFYFDMRCAIPAAKQLNSGPLQADNKFFIGCFVPHTFTRVRRSFFLFIMKEFVPFKRIVS